MNTVRKTIRRMLGMCQPAWYIFLGSLQLSCILLLGSLLLCLDSSGSFMEQCRRQLLAQALYEYPQALLLVGALASVLMEDLYIRRS